MQKAAPAAWIVTGARGKQMFCGAERPELTVIHGNDPVQQIEPLYSQETVDGLTEILKWTRVVAESATSCYAPEDAFDADGGESRQLREILEMADKVLGAGS